MTHRCAATSASAKCLRAFGHERLHLLRCDGFLPRAFHETNLFCSRERADRVEVPPREATARVLPRHLLYGGIEIEEGEQFGNFAFALSRLPREVALRELIGIPESRQRIGQVIGVHVEPLPVLDDLMEEDVLLLRLLYPAGNLRKLCFARGVVAPFPGDDLVDTIRFDEADGDRLEDAESLDRIIEFLLGLRIEPASRLVRIGANMVAGDGEGTAEAATAFK